MARITAKRTKAALEYAQNEQTSAKVARLAAMGLRDPKSLTADGVRRVCASALTQAAAAGSRVAKAELKANWDADAV